MRTAANRSYATDTIKAKWDEAIAMSDAAAAAWAAFYGPALIEEAELLRRLAQQHQDESPMAAARECLLCDARDLVQTHLKGNKT
jgi:hypothetical protein